VIQAVQDLPERGEAIFKPQRSGNTAATSGSAAADEHQ
jgi:hypothetical protein